MPAEWASLTVQAQVADPNSTLHFFREALRLRRSLPQLHDDGVTWIAAAAGCLAYRRGDISVWLNAGDSAVPLPPGELVHASGPVGDDLPPDTAVWLRG
jgi:alpha-glucosidase